jgi:hypothetical protein
MRGKVSGPIVVTMAHLVYPHKLHSPLQAKLHNEFVLHLECDLISVPVVSHQQPRDVSIYWLRVLREVLAHQVDQFNDVFPTLTVELRVVAQYVKRGNQLRKALL